MINFVPVTPRNVVSKELGAPVPEIALHVNAIALVEVSSVILKFVKNVFTEKTCAKIISFNKTFTK